MGNNKISVEKMFWVKIVFVKKNCCSKKNVGTFSIINRLQHGRSGHTVTALKLYSPDLRLL